MVKPDPQEALFGYSLSYTLSKYDKFLQLSPPAQASVLALARKFENKHGAHFLSPDALAEELGGTPAAWRQFLTLKPVKDYVDRAVQEDTFILNRIALFKQAQKAAETGDTQAARYLHQLNELHQAQTNQQTILLHFIPRPNLNPQEEIQEPQSDADLAPSVIQADDNSSQ